MIVVYRCHLASCFPPQLQLHCHPNLFRCTWLTDSTLDPKFLEHIRGVFPMYISINTKMKLYCAQIPYGMCFFYLGTHTAYLSTSLVFYNIMKVCHNLNLISQNWTFRFLGCLFLFCFFLVVGFFSLL